MHQRPQVMHIHKGEVFFRDTGFEWKSDLKAEGFTFSSWDPHNRADRILIRGHHDSHRNPNPNHADPGPGLDPDPP